MSEAAAYTGFSKGYLYQLTASGQIPHSKPRGKIFFDRAKLEKWLLGNPVKTRDEINQQATEYIHSKPTKRRKSP